jgi:hypothetical protein
MEGWKNDEMKGFLRFLTFRSSILPTFGTSATKICVETHDA